MTSSPHVESDRGVGIGNDNGEWVVRIPTIAAAVDEHPIAACRKLSSPPMVVVNSSSSSSATLDPWSTEIGKDISVGLTTGASSSGGDTTVTVCGRELPMSGNADGPEVDPLSEELPFPGFVPISLRYFRQTSKFRFVCLTMITNPWFERVSMMVILLNCVTLGMYQPCEDEVCNSNRCKILQIFDDLIFAFFAIEMAIKVTAMGLYGRGTYLAETWNRLDCFIVVAGFAEYCLDVENMNLSAIRTIRVLRPLRAINRIPSMRILVMLLLDTLPMLGNVLLLCFFVFFIFGIVGVQLWAGLLRQRCYFELPMNTSFST
ncbi:hypothetical protein CHUAL_011883 [Chamberlinius hualienensis]